jgi:hypothetical protein
MKRFEKAENTNQIWSLTSIYGPKKIDMPGAYEMTLTYRKEVIRTSGQTQKS